MNIQEFLLKESHDLIENYAINRSLDPIFTLLFDDGSTTSILLAFDREDYKILMQKLCEDQRVLACTFIAEGWLTKSDDETKVPSECDDKEEIIMLLYNTREGVRESHLYKPGKNGVLELFSLETDYQGRLSNPFGSAKNMTMENKNDAVLRFQESMRKSMCNVYEELNYVVPMLFCLTNTPEQVSFQYIPEDEWNDKDILIKRIRSKCAEPETIAIMLEFSMEPDKVAIVLVTDEVKEIFNYKINYKSGTLEYVNKGTYDGEFSRLFNNK